MATSMAQFFESSFCIETSPLKVSKWCMLKLCLNLTLFFKGGALYSIGCAILQ